MKRVMAIVLIGIFVFVSGVVKANQTDLAVSFSCRKSSNSCFMTRYRPVPGDVLTLTIKILNRLNHQSSHLTVALVGKSSHVGHYINSQSNSFASDMMFQSLASHRQNNESRLRWSKGLSLIGSRYEILTVEWDHLPPVEVKVYIDISDAAAYANFSAQLYRRSPFGFSIPWDYSPQNGIADSFDNRYSDADRSGNADNERGPGSNRHHGDGLTYFEEYRGARLKGVWRPLDPRKKDIFVYSDFYGQPPTVGGGGAGTKGYVERTLGIDANPVGFAGDIGNRHRTVFTMWLVNEDETRNRVINFRDTGHRRMAQEAIAIEESPFEREADAIAWIKREYNFPRGDAFGVAASKSRLDGVPNAPAVMKPCQIFTVFLLRPKYRSRAADKLNNTIAHELGHCIGLEHSKLTDSGSSTDIMAAPEVYAPNKYPNAIYASGYTASRHERDYRLIPKLRIFGDVLRFESLTELPSGSSSAGSVGSSSSGSSSSSSASSSSSSASGSSASSSGILGYGRYCGNASTGWGRCIYGREASNSAEHQRICAAGHYYYSCSAPAAAAHSAHTANSSGSGSGRCGNSSGGANACVRGRSASFSTAHQTTCAAGHTYWACDSEAVDVHRLHRPN